MSKLFSSLKVRGVEFKNRIAVSPMCQYSSLNGIPTDWHLVHLGSRAVGGNALIIQEASAVSPEGRISPEDLGIWCDEQAEAFKRITAFIDSQNSVPGIQLAHAGRKASTYSPWKGDGQLRAELGGWHVYGPGTIPYSENYPLPKEMEIKDIKRIICDFSAAAKRSVESGFRVIELHMAHGYLVHEFLSPASNKRSDIYGVCFENRVRMAVEIVEGVRKVIPEDFPLFVRISSTDWVEGGWTVEDSVRFAIILKDKGVDLIDCSSGGNVTKAVIPVGPGYQVPFAERIKKEAQILTGAVGFITSPEQADNLISAGQADMVLMGRESLRDPYWPLHAAKVLNEDVEWPKQYTRAK